VDHETVVALLAELDAAGSDEARLAVGRRQRAEHGRVPVLDAALGNPIARLAATGWSVERLAEAAGWTVGEVRDGLVRSGGQWRIGT
jgi:hypothetical protein